MCSPGGGCVSVRCPRRPNLLLTVPIALGAAAFLAFLSKPAPATPDPLNPAFKAVHGPVRSQLPRGHQSPGPSPAYSEAVRRQLLPEGNDLLLSRTALGQRPSERPLGFDQTLACATC